MKQKTCAENTYITARVIAIPSQTGRKFIPIELNLVKYEAGVRTTEYGTLCKPTEALTLSALPKYLTGDILESAPEMPDVIPVLKEFICDTKVIGDGADWIQTLTH